jgi:hypothetical protein
MQTLLEIASSIHPKNCPKKSRNSEIDNKNVETDTNFEREIPDEYRENNEYEVYEALESDDRNFDATDDYVSYFQIDPLIERKQDLQAELKVFLSLALFKLAFSTYLTNGKKKTVNFKLTRWLNEEINLLMRLEKN